MQEPSRAGECPQALIWNRLALFPSQRALRKAGRAGSPKIQLGSFGHRGLARASDAWGESSWLGLRETKV